MSRIALTALVLIGCEAPERTAFEPLLTFGPPIRTVGRLAGPGPVFGHIADVEVLPDSSLLVVDRNAATIFHVSPGGSVLTSFGGRGDGPGEFQTPVDVALLPENEYVVLDAERFRVTRVQIGEGRRHRFISHVATGTQALRFCTSGTNLIINAVRGAYALVRVPMDGNVSGGIFDVSGTIDEAFPEEAQGELRELKRQGAVECLPSGEIAFASEWLPEVYVFDIEGGLRDSVSVSPHLTLQYSPDTSRGMTPVLPTEGWVHRAVTVHSVVPEVLAVQYVRYGPGAGDRDDGPVEMRFIRMTDGAQVVREATMPFVAHLGADVAWAWRNLPYPQVVELTVSYTAN